MKEIKKNHKSLKTTLQTAGKLPAEKPVFSKVEKQLKKEYNRNPYF
jgi:hypothetical protein